MVNDEDDMQYQHISDRNHLKPCSLGPAEIARVSICHSLMILEDDSHVRKRIL